jgi:methylthioribose-1-phosphate isomerase
METLHWEGGVDGRLDLIDQTKLPLLCEQLTCTEVSQVWDAIKQLSVRGAPAIGIAAAYAMVLGIRPHASLARPQFLDQLAKVGDYLATSRPTAVNLFWAIGRMRDCAARQARDASNAAIIEALLAEARSIHEEDRAMCHAIGRHGADLLEDGMGVLTHCNAGGLATSEYGTALSVIYTAQDQGKQIHVYADETRPLLQGARLTAWELMQRDVDVTLICDSMAAQVMREGRVQAVLTGADRIAANGDAANKIGTYAVALLAQAHGVPFYVAAPSSTFDLSIASGDRIPIEQRGEEEVTCGMGVRTAPQGVNVYNPAFDVTPSALIRAIICEHGIIQPVRAETVASMLSRKQPGRLT